MKYLFYLLPLLWSYSLLAQTNYVATTPLSATPAIYNTLIGYSAGNAITTGSYNVFLGVNAGLTTTTGSFNTFQGAWAGYANTTGENNTFVGHSAGEGIDSRYFPRSLS